MNFKFRKKKNFFQIIWENYKAIILVPSMIVSYIVLCLFHKFIWVYPGLQGIWAIAPIVDILIIYIVVKIIKWIQKILRFRYLPLDGEDIKNNQLNTINKYMDNIIIIQWGKEDIQKYKDYPQSYHWPKIPDKIAYEILECIVANYEAKDVARYIYKNKKLWDSIFDFCFVIPPYDEIFDKNGNYIYPSPLTIGERCKIISAKVKYYRMSVKAENKLIMEKF